MSQKQRKNIERGSTQDYQFIVEQQANLLQNLLDEINRTVRLHAVTAGVIATGVSIANNAGVLDLGLDLSGDLLVQVVSASPLIFAALIALREAMIFLKGYRSLASYPYFPEPLQCYYSDLRLEPNSESVRINKELVFRAEKEVGRLHIHFISILVLLIVWGMVHVVTP